MIRIQASQRYVDIVPYPHKVSVNNTKFENYAILGYYNESKEWAYMYLGRYYERN
jgi:hypothetical protein